MDKASVFDCSVIDLGQISSDEGNITVLENDKFPFDVKRIFYLYDIKGGESRGAHAHIACHQFLIAASGSFAVHLDDGIYKREVFINRPNLGLHIPPGIWASEMNFSSGAICLVMASLLYSEDDYIRSYKDFRNYRHVTFVDYSKRFLEKSWFWLNDVEIKFLTNTPDFDRELQYKWFNSLANNPNYRVQGVCYEGREIGVLGLKNIDSIQKKGEYFGYIGERDYWSKGIGGRMLIHAQSLAKIEFGLETLYLNVIQGNDRAIKAYQKFGFSKVGQTGDLIRMEKRI